MNLITSRNVRLIRLILCLFLPGQVFGQTPETSEVEGKPTHSGDLVAKLKKSKNSPSYVFHDDALYQEFVRISETKPTHGPKLFVGDAAGYLASCVIKPASHDDRPYFIASIGRHTSIDRNGNATEREVKSIELTKVQLSGSTFRYQYLGAYREKENLEQILHALRVAAGNPPFKKGSKNFDVPNTAVSRGFTDKVLYEEISRIPEKYPMLAEDEQIPDPDCSSVASVSVDADPLQAPAVQMRTGRSWWNLQLLEDKRMVLFQGRREGVSADYELRKIGVYRATTEWEKICRRIVEPPKDSKK